MLVVAQYIEEQDLLALLVSCDNRSSWQCLHPHSVSRGHRGARRVSTACVLWQQKQCLEVPQPSLSDQRTWTSNCLSSGNRTSWQCTNPHAVTRGHRGDLSALLASSGNRSSWLCLNPHSQSPEDVWQQKQCWRCLNPHSVMRGHSGGTACVFRQQLAEPQSSLNH